MLPSSRRNAQVALFAHAVGGALVAVGTSPVWGALVASVAGPVRATPFAFDAGPMRVAQVARVPAPVWQTGCAVGSITVRGTHVAVLPGPVWQAHRATLRRVKSWRASFAVIAGPVVKASAAILRGIQVPGAYVAGIARPCAAAHAGWDAAIRLLAGGCGGACDEFAFIFATRVEAVDTVLAALVARPGCGPTRRDVAHPAHAGLALATGRADVIVFVDGEALKASADRDQ